MMDGYMTFGESIDFEGCPEKFQFCIEWCCMSVVWFTELMLVIILQQFTNRYSSIRPFYVDYHVGLSNSGWRGNFAEFFPTQKYLL